jgi:WD40 repeat protein
MWDLSADPATELRSTASPVRDLTVARVGDTCVLASIQSDGELRVRTKHLDASNAPRDEAAAWRDAMRCNVGTGAQTLAITPDARRIIIGRADGHLLTVDASTGQIVQDVAAHRESVNVVKLTADGGTLVSGGSDDVVHIWRAHPGGEGWEPAARLDCGGDVAGAALHPDGTTLATTARPGCLQLWELPGGRSLGQVRMPEMPWRLAYSPDGNRIAAGSWDRSVQLWSRSGNALIPLRLDMALLGHDQLVINEAFDASGELLASVSNDGSLRIWDVSPIESTDALPRSLDHRRCLVTLDAGAGDSLSVAFLPRAGGDALPVAVGYYDGTVRVWDLGHFNRHISGQLDHQRRLRNLPNEPPARR